MRARDMRISQNEKASAHRWDDVLIVVVCSPIDLKVMICIQLPEFTVEHVEVFVREELQLFVDIIIRIDETQRREQFSPFNITEGEPPKPSTIKSEIDPSDHGLHVPRLELFGVAEEIEPRMGL